VAAPSAITLAICIGKLGSCSRTWDWEITNHVKMLFTSGYRIVPPGCTIILSRGWWGLRHDIARGIWSLFTLPKYLWNFRVFSAQTASDPQSVLLHCFPPLKPCANEFSCPLVITCDRIKKNRVTWIGLFWL
jgi:hypothetical protein